MMNEKIFANEILLDSELDKVAGGTRAELHELTAAFCGNNKVLHAFEDVRNFFSKIGVGSIGNIPMAYAMQGFLGELGIKANISVGWLGTGIRESGNYYSDKATGVGLSHAEVLRRVRDYGNARS